MERDNKGRFVKGNTEGQKIGSIGGLSAKEAQLRGAAKRKENRTLAEVMRRELEKKSEHGDMTKLEYLTLKAIQDSSSDRLSFRDLHELQKILGEDVRTIDIGEGVSIHINSSDEGKGNIERLLEG